MGMLSSISRKMEVLTLRRVILMKERMTSVDTILPTEVPLTSDLLVLKRVTNRLSSPPLLLRVPVVLLLMLVTRVSSSTTRGCTERRNAAQRTLTTESSLWATVLTRDLAKRTG